MAMPEAPMYEDTDLQPRQYNVWFSRQILAMQPVTIAVGMQKPAHQHFRFRVLPLIPDIIRDLRAGSTMSILNRFDTAWIHESYPPFR